MALKKISKEQYVNHIAFTLDDDQLKMLNDLIYIWKIRKSNVINQMLERLINEEETEKEFRSYIDTYRQIPDIQKTEPVSTTPETAYISPEFTEIVKTINFDYRLPNRSIFFRCLITFFYYKLTKDDKQLRAEADKLAIKIMNMGYVVDSHNVIEGKMFFFVTKPK